MFFSPLSVAICCLVSAAVGVFTARFGSRLLDLLERSLPLPTILSRQNQILVDPSISKVKPGEASERNGGAIGNSIETGPEDIFAENKTLLSFNQQLQSELNAAKKEILRQRELMSECLTESRTDSLTNIANRRAFDYEMTRAIAQRRREGSTFSVVMLDIDYFKRINDQYGHIVGDQVLKGFAQILLNAFRASDYVARFGGEEFVAILPNCSTEESCLAAERVRNVINASWIHVGNLHLQVTASFGVKEIHDQETEAELLERVDAALYAAKRNGRDCCYYHLNDEFHRFVAEELQPASRTTRTQESREPVYLDKLAAEFEIPSDQDDFTYAILADEILI